LSELPRVAPSRRTETGPSSLTAITVAPGSSRLQRRPDVWRVPLEASTACSAAGLGTSRTPRLRSTPSVSQPARAVDLGEGVAERREMSRSADAKRRWCREPLFECRPGRGVGPAEELRGAGNLPRRGRCQAVARPVDEPAAAGVQR
jgi:hypothetical protein